MAIYKGHFEDSNGNVLLPLPAGAVTAIEKTSTASQSYTKGEYIYFNKVICKVTQTISSGDTLAIGTNLIQVTLGLELTSHLVASNGVEFTLQDYLDGNYS